MMMGWQWREVKAFLVETWELFYWSLWCPSKLQERLNQVRGGDTQASGIDILALDFSRKKWFVGSGYKSVLDQSEALIFPWLKQGFTQNFDHSRFVSQFFLVGFILSIPTVIVGIHSPLPINWMLFFGPIVITYGIGCLLLPVGVSWSVPFIFALVTSQDLASIVQGYYQSHAATVELFSSTGFPQTQGLGVTVVAFIIGTVVMFPWFIITVSITTDARISLNNDVAQSLGLIISIFVVCAVPSAIGFIALFVVVLTSKLILFSYLIACAIIATTAAPTKDHRWPIGLIITMLLLGFENLGLQVLWTIPVILCGYYRIFPDYLIFIIPSLLNATNQFTPSWLKNITPKTNALAIADRFPAFESEILWFPIPRHDRVLANAFEQSPVQALTLYQKLQDNPLPGPQITIKKALPSILAHSLKAPKTTADLLQIQTHSQLPLLIPEYYQQSIDNETQTIAPIKREPEIAIIFPRLLNLIQATQNALDTGAIGLRERALEQTLNDTKLLATQLPSLLPPKSVTRWQSVLTHWQTLLELELIEQRKLSQGELLSPFQFGNPLRPRDTFKGRRTLADRLYRLILDRNRPTLVLHGPRRFGKTSFLNNLPRLLPRDLIPIYLDLQSSALSSSEPDFWYGLIRAIHRDTHSQNLNLPNIPSRQDFKTNPYTTLEDWLDIALPLLPEGRRLLLNLDEFERIGTAIAGGKLSLNLLNELRHLIQHRDELAFMFSGVQTLDELGPNWSSYFISVVPIEMLYLEPHEAEDLLRNPSPDFKMRYEDGLIESILKLTHCQPYLLQLIGACLVEQANLATVKTATHDLLQLAIPEAFTNGEPYFTNLWQEFTGTTPAETQAGQHILLTIAQSQPPTYNTPEAQAARRRMIRFHVITEDDRIEIPLLERWIQERAIDL